MIVYLAGSLAARLATVLCVVVIALPYLLRRSWLSESLHISRHGATPYRQRLWPHFWLGYAVLGLSLLHAGTVTEAMGRTSQLGIVAAASAFLLLLFEIVLGLKLKGTRGSLRRQLRWIHFWSMVMLSGSLLLHLVLNAGGG